MAKNLIPDICKLLGVETDEIFTIKGYEHYEYRISAAYGILRKDKTSKEWHEWKVENFLLEKLLLGRAEVIKLPWEPKKNEIVWTFLTRHDKICTAQIKFIRSQIECLALYKAGWVFRTKKEAEEALPKVANELGVEYEL